LKRRLKDGSGNPRRLISYFHVAHDDGKILVTAFAAHFKDLLGQAPLEYVTEWRMQKAVRLLQQPDKKLFEIAKRVGYESDAAFSKAFKRVLGVTPGEHRRNSTQAP
jgi:AraC-like DNA-binding protein